MNKIVPPSLPLITIDAFTKDSFSGNGAAICLIEYNEYVPDSVKQKLASEINLSETAFIQCLTSDSTFSESFRFGLRWFTPTNEVALCGHATLAAAAVLFKCMGNRSEQVAFETLSGDLFCRRDDDRIIIDLPLNPPQKSNDESLQSLIREVVGDLVVKDVQYSPTTRKLLIRLDDKYTQRHLEDVKPDPAQLLKSHDGSKVKGIILTLKGSEQNGCVDKAGVKYDFVSRYFAPWNGINEDPVTGSAHTVLGPYWLNELGTNKLYARQCSVRGGELYVLVKEDRVDVSGHSAVVIQGLVNLNYSDQSGSINQ